MSQPTPYTLSFSFTDFSGSYPTTQQPGASLDAEFGAVALTLGQALTNLALLQRDDGRLKNQIVTLDSLSPAVILALGAGVIWLPRGEWVAGTAYAVSDVVAEGTATYVCSTPHTGAADFDDDVTAGYWTKLYDDAGSVPSDGSVTEPKLADGAVTVAKLGFTSLDLAGSIRGATGLAAGTAPLGSLLHAKRATGDALAKVERTTDAQGSVGYQIIGATVTWQFSEAASGTALDVWRNATRVAQFTDAAGLDIAGAVRATLGAIPTAAPGIGLHYAGGTGYLTAYDYTLGAHLPAKIRGLSVGLVASDVEVLTATATGVDITGTAKRGGVELGWLDAPQNIQSSAYTLALTDRGKHVYGQNVAGQSIAVPTNAAVAFPIGTTVAIVNDGSNPITITTTGITLKLAGGALTGNRTIAANGLATLLKVGTDRWFISGAGIA